MRYINEIGTIIQTICTVIATYIAYRVWKDDSNKKKQGKRRKPLSYISHDTMKNKKNQILVLMIVAEIIAGTTYTLTRNIVVLVCQVIITVLLVKMWRE